MVIHDPYVLAVTLQDLSLKIPPGHSPCLGLVIIVLKPAGSIEIQIASVILTDLHLHL